MVKQQKADDNETASPGNNAQQEATQGSQSSLAKVRKKASLMTTATAPTPMDPRQEEEARMVVMIGSLVYNYKGPASDSLSTTKRKSEHDTDGGGVRLLPKTSSEGRKQKETEQKALQSVLNAIHKEIPEDVAELRQSRVYQNTKRLAVFQRDQYMVGRDYATMAQERRKEAKEGVDDDASENNSNKTKVKKQAPAPSSAARLASWATLRRMPKEDVKPTPEPFPPARLPFDPTALGHGQLAGVVSQRLLPLPALHQAALPWACKIPQWIYPPTERALVNIILGQESNLNRILKNRLITFLDNPNNRTAIKTSTQGFILSSSSSSPAGARKRAANNHS